MTRFAGDTLYDFVFDRIPPFIEMPGKFDNVAVRPKSPVDVARALGLCGRSCTRLRNSRLHPVQADKYAGRLDVHPAEIWPEWFDYTEIAS